jgi:TolA-binding protein
MREPSKYTEYAQPELSSSRVDAQWSRISEKLPQPRVTWRVSPRWVVALAAVSALAFLGRGYLLPPTSESVWEGSVVASDQAPVNLTLAEGTLIALDPRSRVSLMHSEPKRVQVSLTGGSARFEVAKKRSRRFSVQLGKVEVLVTGTQFHVARSAVKGGERVRVDVDEGSVEVHRQGLGVVMLEAGDHWSAFVADDMRAAASGSADVSASAEASGLPSPAAGAPDSAVNVVSAETAPSGDALLDHVADETAAESEESHTERRSRPKARGDSADELFDQANVARRAGRVTEAAKLFAALVSRHARDHRAALAAFELGRLRMDSLGDASGAIEALERALKLDARRAFAEDALARLVLAHEALGDRASCTKARARYLARYPEGVHAQHIALRCSGI